MSRVPAWCIARGDPSPEELAALTVVLASRLAAGPAAPSGPRPLHRGRPDRTGGWRRRPRPGWKTARFPGERGATSRTGDTAFIYGPRDNMRE